MFILFTNKLERKLPNVLDDILLEDTNNVILKKELKGLLIWTIAIAIFGVMGWFVVPFFWGKFINAYVYLICYGHVSVFIKTNYFSLLDAYKWGNMWERDAHNYWIMVDNIKLILVLLLSYGFSLGMIKILIAIMGSSYLSWILLFISYVISEYYLCYNLMKKKEITEYSILGKAIILYSLLCFGGPIFSLLRNEP